MFRLDKRINIISCNVFRSAISSLRLEESRPDTELIYLPSHLHARPDKLRDVLTREMEWAKDRSGGVICLYGDCCPDLGAHCKKTGALKVPGSHCYEILLGKQFREIIDETAGVYFMEKELAENFEELCLAPMELHDRKLREFVFQHYTKLLYIRQPSDRDLLERVRGIAGFLGLELVIRDADYSHLERLLDEILFKIHSDKRFH